MCMIDYHFRVQRYILDTPKNLKELGNYEFNHLTIILILPIMCELKVPLNE